MIENHDRLDPDTLLKQLEQEEARSRRGRLKIFFGSSAGVGKTYAMLSSARLIQAQGTRLIVGLVETHGRIDTEAMASNLPRLPLKDIPYRDRTLHEFDLDAALAWASGYPGSLILLDELAHSNASGSRHPKRWQDVEELLEAGIDIWTTMNVQHLESLNDIVSGITGIRVWETVPDRIFDEADEVVVVDLPPDELLDRLASGKVYVPHQAERAAKHFFRKGNLLALRELALRRTADRVDSEMQIFRRQTSIQSVWPNRESLLACVGSGEHGEKVVRRCARLASQLGVSWHAIHVETPKLHRMPESSRQHPLRVLKLAQELGAQTSTLSAPNPAEAIIRYARENNLSRIVVGRQERHLPWKQSLADRIASLADDMDVLQVAMPTTGGILVKPALTETEPASWSWQGYVVALISCGITALFSTPLLAILDLTNIVMLFLLAVVIIALRYGRGPAVAAAVIGVALFDLYFVSPRFTFAVSDAQYLVTFTVMLVVALVIGQLTAGLKAQADTAIKRERRMRALYEMSRDLSAALMPEQIAEIAGKFLSSEFNAKSTVLAADEDDHIHPPPNKTMAIDMGMVQWVFDHGETAGTGTDTLAGSPFLMLPLKATMKLRGVLIVEPGWKGLLAPDQRRLLDTCASLLAISLERIHYIDIAQKSLLRIESERLRNSLLSAISHDLRTPLTSLAGLADALSLTKPSLTDQQEDIRLAIKQSALRMGSLVNNLLDMARIEAGATQLNQAWQPLEEVLGSAVASCKPILDQHPVEICLPEHLPLLHLDAVLIERVFVNLLENAVKYTPASSRIVIAAEQEKDSIIIHVDDKGPGLPKESEKRIFEKFERGVRETATPGVGLGLAICRAIITAHGGTIEAENRHSNGSIQGARFTIILPAGHPPTDDGSEAIGSSTQETQS